MDRVNRLIGWTRRTVAAVLALLLLAPAYLLLFVPLRLARWIAGRRDPMGLAFPGPPGSLWIPRRPPPPDADRRMS